MPIRTNCRAACVSASRSGWRRCATPSSSSPTSRPPRSTWWCRRTCSALIRDLQQRDGRLGGVRHPRHERPRQHGRPRRHHLCRPARGGRADARPLRGTQASLYGAPGREPAAHRRHHASARRSRVGRPTLPNHRPAAAFIRAARSRSTSARQRCRRSRRSRPGTAPPAGAGRTWSRSPVRSAMCRGPGVGPMTKLLEVDHVTKSFPLAVSCRGAHSTP